MKRNKKLELLNQWKKGKLSGVELREIVIDQERGNGIVVICKGWGDGNSESLGPFDVDGKEYNKNEFERYLVDRAEASLPDLTILFLPEEDSDLSD